MPLERWCQRDVQGGLAPACGTQQALFLQGWGDQLEAQRHTGLTQPTWQRQRGDASVGPGGLKAGVASRVQVTWRRSKGGGGDQDVYVPEHLWHLLLK